MKQSLMQTKQFVFVLSNQTENHIVIIYIIRSYHTETYKPSSEKRELEQAIALSKHEK